MTAFSYVTLVLGFALSFLLALYFVPVMRQAALKWGVLDRPDGRLKQQKDPVPYLGGIAVYLAFLLSISFVFEFTPQVLAILLGGTIMLLIGLVDDFGVLLPYQKFLGQVLATYVLIKGGIRIDIDALPFWFSYPLTVLWMVGIINAVNIIDVSDGLSSGVCFVVCLVLGVVGLINGYGMIAHLALVLAGALAGFLTFNWSPARIYLGDTGTLFIGLMVGALAMLGDYSRLNFLAIFAPVLILGVPIFDTILVMWIRARKGRPVFLGSPDHFALRLKRRGWSASSVATLAMVGTLLLGMLAILTMYLLPAVTLAVLLGLAGLTVGLMVWFQRSDP